jgi:exodeoxyribonuclease III
VSLKVASWNINSVRLRADLIARYAAEASPDVLCLQETKTQDATFPYHAVHACGFKHILHCGQKSYNGVAILSKFPLTPLPVIDVVGDGSCRHVAAIVDGRFALHNVYIPAGGDIPDAALNPKFKEKLICVETLTNWSPSVNNLPVMVLGDFNIAPYEHDVWSHKQLQNVVSHTPIEVEALERFRESGAWVDSARAFIPPNEKLYSWWSYRNRDWRASNRGRRLDHIWVTPSLAPAMESYHTHTTARDWDQPSDHVPIMLSLKYESLIPFNFLPF